VQRVDGTGTIIEGIARLEEFVEVDAERYMCDLEDPVTNFAGRDYEIAATQSYVIVIDLGDSRIEFQGVGPRVW
tara:strand:- start:2655 stop:2876 length:222 start_codon:yes stop_codon:yes gene_type:complete